MTLLHIHEKKIVTHTKIRNLRVFVLEKKYLKKRVTFFSHIFFFYNIIPQIDWKLTPLPKY